jgi:hypothetical protein
MTPLVIVRLTFFLVSTPGVIEFSHMKLKREVEFTHREAK